MNDFDKTSEQTASDAKEVDQDGSDKVKGVISSVKQVANDAMDTGREYAKDALNSAGKKIDSTRSQFEQGCQYLSKAINEEPVKAVVITAVVSSLLTALLVSARRSNDRY